ncbi:trypsin-like serine peptidase [Geodermatophilus sp. SYSU D01180]
MAENAIERNRDYAAVRADPLAAAGHFEPRERQVRFLRRRGVAVHEDADDETLRRGLEKTFGTRDFLAGRWLTDGAARSDAVARIEIGREHGTGFLVSPWLLLTNDHVLPDEATAAGAGVTFRYVEDGRQRIARSQVVRLDPGRCFVTSDVDLLDYTLVAVDTVGGKPPGQRFGYVPLVGSTGKVLVGQPVNIIQHPGGDPRQIAVRENLLVAISGDHYLVYETDTEGGSSGAPVFNDSWELVALHKGMESARDDEGREIDVHGRRVTAGTPAVQRVWVANRGVRVSAIVGDLEGGAPLRSGTEVNELVDELLRLGGNQ